MVPDKRILSTSEKLEKVERLVRQKRFRQAEEALKGFVTDFNLEAPSDESARYHYLNAYIHWETGEKKRGLTSARTALEMFMSLKDFSGIAKAESLVGALLIDLGDLKKSKEHLEQAVSGFRFAKDYASVARSLNQLAYLHYVKGELKRSLQLVGEARENAIAANDLQYEIVQKGSAASCLVFLGRWKEATAILKDFLPQVKRAGDSLNFILGTITFGKANFLIGKYQTAIKNYQEAIRISKEEGLLGNLKIGYELIAEAYIHNGRFTDAEENLKKALEIGERVSPYGTIMTQCWRLMGDLHNAKGESHKALEAYNTCESYLIKLPEELERGACFVGKGLAYARQEEWSVARSNFEKALDVFAQCENDWEMAKAVTAAAESGVYSAKQVKGQLFWAREIFQKLEYPSWEKRVDDLLASPEVGPLNGVPLRSEKAHLERERVLAALEEAEGNRTKAAEILKVPRTTLCSILKRINGSK